MAGDTHCTFQLATSVGLQTHLFYLRLTFLVGLSSQSLPLYTFFRTARRSAFPLYLLCVPSWLPRDSTN